MMQLLILWKYFLWIQSIRPCFLADGKKLMWVLFQKKNIYIYIYIYIVDNYRPVSLLPIASKIFEKAVYHSLLNYFECENLLNINQSGFCANDSCINQLISITCEVYRAFNSNASLIVWGIFLDLSKAFGTRDFYSNLNLLESVESCSIFLKTIFLIGFKRTRKWRRI